MDIISKQTRIAFREHLVGWTLATIRNLFDAADLSTADIDPAALPSGERRSLVEQYYASIDWTSSKQVQTVCVAFENVLERLDEPNPFRFPNDDARKQEQRKLLNLLRRDGFTYSDGRLRREGNIDLKRIESASSLVDRAVLRDHLDRIERGIDCDPGQAVGSAKELIETVSKQILNEFHQTSEQFDSLQQLVKAAMKSLDLSLEAIPDASKGANSLKQVLSGLNQVTGGIAELRNLYGTGHGRLRGSGLQPRHARLVVGAVATLSVFLLETLDERQRSRVLSKPAPI
jgi:hypothetical protein